jgi:hypothetical protein
MTDLDPNDAPERDCTNCGERIILVPITPDPLRGNSAWFHLATGRDVCDVDPSTLDPDAPTPMAAPREDGQ